MTDSKSSNWLGLVLATVTLLLLYWHQQLKLISFLVYVKKLKWFWLSLIVVYFWFTPGQPLLERLGRFSPTIDGLELGAYRIGILLVLLLAVNLLLRSTSTQSLYQGLYILFLPLNWKYKFAETFSRRAALVLEVMSQVEVLCKQQDIKLTRSGIKARADRMSVFNIIDRIAKRGAYLFDQVVECASQQQETILSVPEKKYPPLFQFCFPILIFAALFVVNTFLD